MHDETPAVGAGPSRPSESVPAPEPRGGPAPSATPQFLIRGTYRPGAETRRDAAMADHLAYLRVWRDRIRFSGPLLTDDGSTPIGNATILEVSDRAAVESYVEGESFHRAGMFGRIEIQRFVPETDVRQTDLVPAPGLMMFVCECIDGHDAARQRERAGADHRAYRHRIADQIVTAGLLLDDDGEDAVRGSLLVVEVPDRRHADDLVRSDPLTQAGAFGSIRMDRWRFGKALGDRRTGDGSHGSG